jgi:hypothetical protein
MYRATISMLGCFFLAGTSNLAAQSPLGPKAGYTINGVIRNESEQPVPDAQISLSREGQPARLFRTAADGQYSFTSVTPGKVQLSVRRLGFRGAAMTVEEIPSDLANVLVDGSKGHLDEYNSHKANNNFAKFFDQREIEKRHPAFLSELLRTVPGASLYASERSGNRIMLRDCKPMVWLDGMRAQGAELDEVVKPTDVAGLEVYPSSAGLPPQYQDRNNRMCGAIVVWTRNQ